MPQDDRGQKKSAGPVAVVSSLLVILSLVVALLGSATAGAQTRSAAGAAASATCPTDYTGNTVPNCTTTTTTPKSTTTTPKSTTTTPRGITVVLSLIYLARGQTSISTSPPPNPPPPPASGGAIDWMACGFPLTAVGVSVHLSLQGQLVTIAGGTGIVGSNGCVPDPQVAICLNPGVYAAATAATGYPAGGGTLTVSGTPTCANPTGPNILTGISNVGSPTPGSATPTAAAPTASAPAPSGALAFTGANVLRLLLIALVVIVIGSVIARASRRRKHGL